MIYMDLANESKVIDKCCHRMLYVMYVMKDQTATDYNEELLEMCTLHVSRRVIDWWAYWSYANITL